MMAPLLLQWASRWKRGSIQGRCWREDAQRQNPPSTRIRLLLLLSQLIRPSAVEQWSEVIENITNIWMFILKKKLESI